MTERSTSETGELTRRRFMQGSALTGVAAFLAACSSGTGASATPATSAAPANSPAPGASATSCRKRCGPDADRTTEFRELGRLHRPDDGPRPADGQLDTDETTTTCPSAHPRRVRGQVRRRGQLQERGDRRQRVRSWTRSEPQLEAGADTGWDLIVLTDWMAAKAGRGCRLGGRAHQANARPRPNVRDDLHGLPWDPDIQLPLPVAVRRDRRRLQQASPQARPHQARRPVRPGLRRKGHVARRDPATRSRSIHLMLQVQGKASDNAARGDDRRRRPGRPRLPQAVRGQRALPRASPATSTSRTSAAATPGPPSSGPATSPRPPATRRCLRLSRRRAPSSGPTT